MSNPYESPTTQQAVTSAKSVEIKRLGVMSCGKVFGALYGGFGLIAGVIVTVFALAGLSGDGGGAMFGALAIILLPLIYGIAGFIGGIIMAALYNIAAGFAGGIEMEIA